MGARQRLNSLYFTAILIMATLLGSVTESWGIFTMVILILTVILVHGGSIRPTPTPRHRQRSRRRS